MSHFTLQDLVDFTQNERKMVEDVLPTATHDREVEPSEACLRNILDYSKALSVRTSKKMKQVHVILN
ncbi:MAG: hypothetical protein ACK50N_05425 [Flavobacteriales bacterium]|jgi:hypothetical protein